MGLFRTVRAAYFLKRSPGSDCWPIVRLSVVEDDDDHGVLLGRDYVIRLMKLYFYLGEMCSMNGCWELFKFACPWARFARNFGESPLKCAICINLPYIHTYTG